MWKSSHRTWCKALEVCSWKWWQIVDCSVMCWRRLCWGMLEHDPAGYTLYQSSTCCWCRSVATVVVTHGLRMMTIITSMMTMVMMLMLRTSQKMLSAHSATLDIGQHQLTVDVTSLTAMSSHLQRTQLPTLRFTNILYRYAYMSCRVVHCSIHTYLPVEWVSRV